MNAAMNKRRAGWISCSCGLGVLLISMVLAGLIGGCRGKVPREKVVNPMIDSADKFDTAYTETVQRKLNGLELFMKMMAGETTLARESVPGVPRDTVAGVGTEPEAHFQETLRAPTPWPGAAGETRPAGYTSQSDSGLIVITGTVRRMKLEGGFWGFEAEDGRRFDPLNLPTELQQDGQRTKLWMRPIRDVATIRMWGTPVRVVRYARARP